MPKSFLVRKHIIEEILRDEEFSPKQHEDDIFSGKSVSLPEHLVQWLHAHSRMEEAWRVQGHFAAPPTTTSIIYPRRSIEPCCDAARKPKVEVAKTFQPILIGAPRSATSSPVPVLTNHQAPSPDAVVRSSNVRMYPCLDCGKSFQRASSLSNHRLIHKNVKAFECEKCGMKFLRKSDLGKHTVIHTGMKPYSCDVCGKSFSQSSNMLTHRRRHSGMRPFHCKDCGKAFYRKVDVRRHARVHAESPPPHHMA